MHHRPSAAPPRAVDRRRWLRQAGGAALATLGLPPLLAACGGGGAPADPGSVTPPPAAPPPVPAAPSGLLAYRNNSMAALHDFDSQRGLAFEPGDGPLTKIGVAATPEGLLVTALEGDNSEVRFASFDRQGRPQGLLRLARPFAFATSLPMFNAAGTRAAIALNELATPGGSARVDRVVVVSWPVSFELSRFDGWNQPVWAGDQLLLRNVDNGRLRLFGTDLRTLGDFGPAAGIADNESFSVGPDARHLLYSRDSEIRCFDRQTLADTVAARRDIARLTSPCLSPDGRWLALHTQDSQSGTPDFHTYFPHVLPFDPAGAVQVDSARHALAAPAIVETGGRMVWLR